MRRLMATALIPLLLVPMLVCAAAVCPHHPQTAQAFTQPHCDEGRNETRIEQTASFMLFADCMGIDLEHALSSSQLNNPSFVAESIAFASIDFWVALSVEDSSFHRIRGSPYTPHPASVPQQPIYLTTLRFRV